jgi:hypothetical protein
MSNPHSLCPPVFRPSPKSRCSRDSAVGSADLAEGGAGADAEEDEGAEGECPPQEDTKHTDTDTGMKHMDMGTDLDSSLSLLKYYV